MRIILRPVLLTPPRREDERVVGQTTGPSRPLTFDEVVALFVAFLSLGSVLLWGLTRGGIDLFSESLASADNSIVSSDEDGGAPFAFPLGSNNEATAGDVDQENARALADGNDGAGAVAGRDGLPARLPRERRSNNVWGGRESGYGWCCCGYHRCGCYARRNPCCPNARPTAASRPLILLLRRSRLLQQHLPKRQYSLPMFLTTIGQSHILMR